MEPHVIFGVILTIVPWFFVYACWGDKGSRVI